MRKTIHICVSVRGAIRRLAGSRAKWAPGFTSEGKPMTREQALSGLMDELAQVMPMGDPCEGWSWTKGCPGHVVPDGPAAGIREAAP